MEDKICMQTGFRCEASDLDANKIFFLNGKLVSPSQELSSLTALGLSIDVSESEINLVCKSVISKPLQIINLYAESAIKDGESRLRHIKIRMEENAKLSFLHCVDTDDRARGALNEDISIFIGKNAELGLLSLQNINEDCSINTGIKAEVGENGKLKTFFASLNGGTIQNNQNIELNELGACAEARGIYLLDSKQRVCNKVLVEHNCKETKSLQLFKGVLDERASGLFEGHIRVQKDAQKIEAYQTNRNILLSEKAQFRTLPLLEIYADDVKCSHGATVGQLDENALFYMRCRGIGKDEAKRLLMQAFCAEVVEGIAFPEIETQMNRLVARRLKGELGSCKACLELGAKE